MAGLVERRASIREVRSGALGCYLRYRTVHGITQYCCCYRSTATVSLSNFSRNFKFCKFGSRCGARRCCGVQPSPPPGSDPAIVATPPQSLLPPQSFIAIVSSQKVSGWSILAFAPSRFPILGASFLTCYHRSGQQLALFARAAY